MKVGGTGQSTQRKAERAEKLDRDVTVTVLESLDRLKDQFRHDSDKVRLIALLSPT